MSPATGQGGGALARGPLFLSWGVCGQCMHFLPQIQRHVDVVRSALRHRFNPKGLITQEKVGVGRRALLEPGPDHLSKCAGLRGGGGHSRPPETRGGGAVAPGILQRKVLSGPQGCMAHVALSWWPPSLRGIPARTSVRSAWDPQQRDSSACPPSDTVLAFRARAYLLPNTSSEAEVTSAFGVRASPRISPSPGQSQGVSPPKTALRRAPQPWQGPVTLPSRCCQTSLGCERLRGARGRAAEAGRKPRDAGLPGGAGADVRGALWDTRPGPLAASSPLEYPDFVDGRQGGRHVGLKVSVVHPGLAKRPRRGVVLPVVVPVPFAVRPEAVQVHLRAGQR